MNEVKLFYQQLVEIKEKVKNNSDEIKKEIVLLTTRLIRLHDFFPGRYILCVVAILKFDIK